MKYKIICYACLLFIAHPAVCQTYSPIQVTGFTQDLFAEAGTNAAAVTTTTIDGTNHIMYTAGFAATNGLAAGVFNSGTIVNGSRTFQLAPYAGNNALYLSLNGTVANTTGSSTLAVQTPASYSRISFLSFSTEGSSTLNVVLTFTDGTIFNAGNFLFQDWFGGPNPVYSAFGRITRLAAPPYMVDGLPADPRWYAADIPISCANQNKLLQSITINYVSQSGTSGRAVALAVSGVAYTPMNVTGVITPATCGSNNGSIALTATGGTPPLTYTWNTTPVQTTSTATGLGAGTYTGIVTDANGCQALPFTGTVTQTSTITATITASPVSICSGDSATLTATATGSSNTFSWSPGGQTGASIRVSPADTTTYSVTVTDGSGCSTIATKTLPVKKKPSASFTVSPPRICLGTNDTITFTGSAGAAATYNWDFSGATVISGSGAGPYVLLFTTAGSHTIRLTASENGCSSTEAIQTILADARSQPQFTATPTNICSGDSVQVIFTGTAAAGATATWNWGGGTVVSGTGTGPYTVKYSSGGSIRLILSNNTCIDSSASIPVTVTPKPVATFTSDVLQGCTPLTASFTNTSQAGTTYNWNFGDNTSSTNQTPAPHGYTTAGNYNVSLTVTSGSCSATSPVQVIQVSDPPVADFSSMPDVTATPVQLSGAQFSFSNHSVGATSYTWYFGDHDSSSQMNPLHRYTTAGSFAVTLYAFNNLGCFDSISVAPYLIIADSSLHIPNAFSPNGDGINDQWLIPGLQGYPDCQVQIFDRYGQVVYKSTGYPSPWTGIRNGIRLPIGTYYYIIRTSIKNYTGWVLIVR